MKSGKQGRAGREGIEGNGTSHRESKKKVVRFLREVFAPLPGGIRRHAKHSPRQPKYDQMHTVSQITASNPSLWSTHIVSCCVHIISVCYRERLAGRVGGSGDHLTLTSDFHEICSNAV